MNRLALGCFTLLACTYGGSNEDPRVPVGPEPDVDDALLDASMDEDPPAKPPSTAGESGKAPMNSVDATRPRADATAGDNTCQPITPAVCDPVRNTGCPPFTQCDIETAATPPTGRCVFFQVPLGPGCAANVVSTTCEAQATCAGMECRKLCYCDSDCPAGECCSDTSGPGPAGAFKLCRPC